MPNTERREVWIQKHHPYQRTGSWDSSIVCPLGVTSDLSEALGRLTYHLELGEGAVYPSLCECSEDVWRGWELQ